MRPSPRLIKLLSLCFLIALIIAFWPLLPNTAQSLRPILLQVWIIATVMLVIAASIDALRRQRLRKIEANRQHAGNLALGQTYPVTLHVANTSDDDIYLKICDHHSPNLSSNQPDSWSLVPAKTGYKHEYKALADRRGDAEFYGIEVAITSLWGLWQHRKRIRHSSLARIYPNFASVAQLNLIDPSKRAQQMGLHQTKQRGQGTDFRQLRAFRQGDAIRQIDWKASSRIQKLISRDYQAEQDQDIIFLLDSGRRMRAMDNNLSHFDYCLNALLLLSYVALKQGDAVGLLNFAGTQRWLPPGKGEAHLNKILNQVYDLHSSTEHSDLLEAAEKLGHYHRKRSLVILLSNLKPEDNDNLLSAVQLLQRKHLVMVASLQESSIEETEQKTIVSETDALTYLSISERKAQRKKMQYHLKQRHINFIDTLPGQLHSALIDEYLHLKRSGKI